MAQMINSGGGKGRKYALLTEEMYRTLKNLNQRSEQTESPEFVKVKQLDDQIKKILDDTSIGVNEKARLYSQIAAKYISFRSRAPETAQRQPVHFAVATRDMEIQPPQQEQQQDQIMQQEVEPREEEMPEEEEEVFQVAPEDEPPMAIASEKPQLPSSSRVPSISSQAKDILRGIENETRKDKAEEILKVMIKNRKLISYNPNTEELDLKGINVPGTDISEILDYVTKNNPSKTNKPPGVGRFLQALGEAKADPKLVPNTDLWNLVSSVPGSVSIYGKGKKPILHWQKF